MEAKNTTIASHKSRMTNISQKYDTKHFRELSYFNTSKGESSIPYDDVKSPKKGETLDIPISADEEFTTDEEKTHRGLEVSSLARELAQMDIDQRDFKQERAVLEDRVEQQRDNSEYQAARTNSKGTPDLPKMQTRSTR